MPADDIRLDLTSDINVEGCIYPKEDNTYSFFTTFRQQQHIRVTCNQTMSLLPLFDFKWIPNSDHPPHFFPSAVISCLSVLMSSPDSLTHLPWGLLSVILVPPLLGKTSLVSLHKHHQKLVQFDPCLCCHPFLIFNLIFTWNMMCLKINNSTFLSFNHVLLFHFQMTHLNHQLQSWGGGIGVGWGWSGWTRWNSERKYCNFPHFHVKIWNYSFPSF